MVIVDTMLSYNTHVVIFFTKTIHHKGITLFVLFFKKKCVLPAASGKSIVRMNG